MGIIYRNGRKYSGTRVVDNANHLFAEDTTGTSVSAQTMLSNILGDFATTEDSVAQENHSVGDYIVLGSYFYKVTAAITAGDTLVEGVNGNIERTNVGAEVSGISSQLEIKTSGMWKYIQMDNGIVIFWGFYEKTVAAATNDSSTFLDYPVTLLEKPFVATGLVAGGSDIYKVVIERTSTSKDSLRITLCNGHSAATAVGANFIGIGKWK